ncbi:MAG: lytic transglycosylase domain-containing protein [Thiomonas arsenitoxydans]|uniref:Lytic transglycosylase domain-containing protein n=2 Tax=Burkholderiales genera incertae sedis TaxID=224471 RepID=A0A8I1SUF5_THIA3|nr:MULTISPECIES: lytic transglycosylase domain-containing protein [Thiomonas]MBN8744560.1 lytic transglycosylase domain-containing protein [Thiomonas arsenitoxydans]ODU94928.1 MAG: lytic transglycosylase [Thiomonas sp. SCN 64-16]
MTPAALLYECAPAIAPVTMAAIVQQESGGNPLALHDNTTGRSYRPASHADAAQLARDLVAQGHSVDIGLAQINSRNLQGLGMTVDQALQPCENLRAAQSVLLDGWKRSGDLRATLSAYNTGKLDGSTGAGYGASVFDKAGVTVPAIPGGKMARWAVSTADATVTVLPPVRPVVTWTPQASPLSPNCGGLAVKW